MVFVYGMFYDAKIKIRTVCNKRTTICSPVIKIVKNKGKNRLDNPLYLAAYLLNLFYLYMDIVVHKDTTIRETIIHCLDVLYFGPITQDLVANTQL